MVHGNVNCIYFHDGVCSHPTARGLFFNKKCIFADISDTRASGCHIQIKQERSETPPPPPPPPPVRRIREGVIPPAKSRRPHTCEAKDEHGKTYYYTPNSGRGRVYKGE